MAIEIERKFLVKGDAWRSWGQGKIYRQGYILTQNEMTTVRIRIVEDCAFLTFKAKTKGFSREEFEYSIPLEDAEIILKNLCDYPLIQKIRYRIHLKNLVWEVDEFQGENEGLILAEVELSSEDQYFELPAWIGEEVTQDLRFYNVNLAKHPYSIWK
ncbi:CYTH domain-containing protein [cyanobacterium endosymbiont of Epithemia turgida]|jgi:CYTH domain-containing protein|uniref:CYTH domain-containing protein n=1 Tax=cyanobacterium endosymbiont of Epithemia turgida TaxID=718217 RepID=UPI0004D1628F|nr:CYTH domain-containing protein [cyanobacterium endosymbiont of Epithemia turgida]BAP18167.1 putative adenylate cyclase [cyanobacterium endosymbiont of Epithemia turgida isolate EtSB Lake Yunoko]